LSIEAPPRGALAGALERQFGVERAVPVGRAALGLSVVLDHWRERRGGCRVALPGAICHEVVVAVLAAKCEPIFCDVDPADGLVTESEWWRARSLGADVAIVVHLYGNPADTVAVRKIFRAPNCLLIDDAAQALGSNRNACMAGAGGDVGLLSFGHTKQISVGNAALLFTSIQLAEEVSERLRARTPQPQSVIAPLAAAFRRRLDIAREHLRGFSDNAAKDFTGLLEGLAPLLAVPFSEEAAAAAVRELAGYAETAQIRVAKMDLWSRGLEGSGLEPVGMAKGCVPWRYTCRLPGLDWSQQHRFAETIRAAGIHVSNWYLPAHWFLGQPAGSLPGVERLAREVFQFWLDENATHEAIAHESAFVRRLMS
jgi:dTDP-4-amino-4,6-dideoxygalactose transaminase